MTRLFVDMDGTLARFHDEVQYLERMFEKGFFLGLKPFEEAVEAINSLAAADNDCEVFILSAAIDGEPPYCRDEKHQWIDKYCPDIDREHRIFTQTGVPKIEYIPGGVSESDILWDDYNKNLEEWQAAGGTAVKCHNNINHKGLIGALWQGALVSNSTAPEEIENSIMEIIEDCENSDDWDMDR